MTTAPVFFVQVGKSSDQVVWVNGSSDVYDFDTVSRFARRLLVPHEPEHIVGQAEDDARQGRSEFYVYVLDTDYGHYVGHTYDPDNRLRQHQADEVPSTAGTNPEILWVSSQLPNRNGAQNMEAVLKTLRDAQSPVYKERTGHNPRRWNYPMKMTEFDHVLWELSENLGAIDSRRAVEITVHNEKVGRPAWDYKMDIKYMATRE